MPTSNHSKQTLISHVQYINILTWIWAFQDKLLYLVVFSLYSRLFCELRDKRNFKKKFHFWPESLGAISEYWYIEHGQTQNHVCAHHFFVVKFQKVRWKYCKYCFDCFLLAGGDKVGSLADVEFTLVWCGSLADSLQQLSFVLALRRLDSV